MVELLRATWLLLKMKLVYELVTRNTAVTIMKLYLHHIKNDV